MVSGVVFVRDHHACSKRAVQLHFARAELNRLRLHRADRARNSGYGRDGPRRCETLRMSLLLVTADARARQSYLGGVMDLGGGGLDSPSSTVTKDRMRARSGAVHFDRNGPTGCRAHRTAEPEPRLFVAQREYRIDSHGARRGHKAGGHPDGDDGRDGRQQDQRIDEADACEVTKNRSNANVAPTPMTSPIASCPRPRRSTSAPTACCVAPSASRIPSSFRRSRTECAVTAYRPTSASSSAIAPMPFNEHARDSGRPPRLPQRFRQGHRPVERELRIELAQCGTNRRGERRRNWPVGAHQDCDGAAGAADATGR